MKAIGRKLQVEWRTFNFVEMLLGDGSIRYFAKLLKLIRFQKVNPKRRKYPGSSYGASVFNQMFDAACSCKHGCGTCNFECHCKQSSLFAGSEFVGSS